MASRKTKFVEKCTTFKFASFDYEVRIILTNNVSESRRRRCKLFGPYDGDPGFAMTIGSVREGHVYIILPFESKPSTISHESWHVVRRMLEFCGAGLDSEVVAYHLGHLVGFLHRTIVDAKRELRRKRGTSRRTS